MCSSKAKVTTGVEISTTPTVARINGRPVLQPTCNRVPPTLDRLNSLKKIPSPPPATTSATIGNGSRAIASITPPLSPKSPGRQDSICCDEKFVTPRKGTKTLERKKSKSFKESMHMEASLSYSSTLVSETPGSIAAVRREQMALQQAQRKMKISHYGRSKSAKFESNCKVVPLPVPLETSNSMSAADQVKRCNFITPNSDPIYVAYHDEEWGVPIHNDSMLFELLVLSGAQVGSDWTSILKKRQDFRDAFAGFGAETVANFSEKQITTICSEYGIDISKVRGVVDNSKRILEVKAVYGSFDKYIWGFVNHKPISTQYKFGHKIPVKTSKSESISKDMVRRGFRFVGPTVVHSFMQAAGLTNDHLITCHRHLPCALLAIQKQPLESLVNV